jgi:aryl-alcohol dehydrogenase-like predicted oxidoreductase
VFRGETLRRNLAVVDQLKGFAIAWTLANPAVDVAIVGARTAQQIEQTAAAADIHLQTEDLAEIDRIMRGAVPVGGPNPEGV